jgi:hypothetical protein
MQGQLARPVLRGARVSNDPRLLDAMKFRAAELSVLGSRMTEGPDWSRIESELKSAKWLVWHGKGRKALPRLQTISDELENWPGLDQSTLSWNVRKVSTYIRSHTRFLVDYGARYRKGLPISSGIAESAVNQVVSTRMAKKQQMRWSDEGAHTLALVRVADLNEELSAESFTPVAQFRPSVVEKIDRTFYGVAA